MRPAVFVGRNGFNAARRSAGAHVASDCVVRACRLAPAAFYTFRLVDERLAVHYRDRALGTAFYTCVGYAVSALVGYDVFVIGATVASGRNDLH